MSSKFAEPLSCRNTGIKIFPSGQKGVPVVYANGLLAFSVEVHNLPVASSVRSPLPHFRRTH